MTVNDDTSDYPDPNEPPTSPAQPPLPHEGSETPHPSTLGMTNTASTAITEVDPEFKKKGLQKIRAIVDGNGIKGEDVTEVNFDGGTLQYLATTKLQFRFKTLERVEAGKRPGKQLPSPKAIHEEIAKQEQKITHRADIVKQVQTYVAEERKDMGYGLDGQIIKLPFLYTDYVFYEACKNCHAKGQVQCQRCHGQGHEMCPQCHGQGLDVCQQCNGSQFIQGPNGRQQCPRCFGRGKTSCSLCNERRKVQCRVCKTKGTIQCSICNGHAWNTHFYRLEIDAMPSFDLDRSNIKDRVGDVINDLGPELITKGHAQAKVIYKEQNEKQSEDKRDYITVPYMVQVPFGELRYKIGEETHGTLLFGYNCALYHLPDLLDKLLKTPIKRLQEAAENRGNVAEKVQKCAQYRTLRGALLASSRYPLKKAAKKIKMDNPQGLRNETIKQITLYSDRALKNITRKPRKQGFYIALALMAVIFGIYFPAGVQAMIAAAIPAQIIQLGFDIAVFALALTSAFYLVKFMSRHAMKQALGDILTGSGKLPMPKLGKTAERLAYIAPALYLIALEASVHLATAPWWYMQLRGMITGLM